MNIMIVDAEIETRKAIELYIKKYGGFNTCVLCSNSLEALAQAEKISFDFALLDIQMPFMNGLQLAEKLVNLFPDISIVFISAYNNYATEAFELNAIDYVLKPIREERLYKALDKLFRLKGLAVQIAETRPELNIQTFGRLTVKAGDKVLKWNRQKSAEIFGYLLMNHEKAVHKEKLCDLLWPDFEPHKALASLQTAMCQVRKTLAVFDRKQINIDYTENCYRLMLGNGYYDAEEFEALSKKVLNNEEINSLEILEQAVELYSGGFMEEQGWLWSVPERERLELKYKLLMKRLIEGYIQHGWFEKSFEYMKKLAEMVPEDDLLLKNYFPMENWFSIIEETKHHPRK